MERQTLNIEKVEKKVTKKDKIYVRLKADGSWYSCFRSELFNQLLEGRSVNVDIEEETQGDKTFYNIVQVYAVGPPSETPAPQSQPLSKPSDPASGTNGSQGQSSDQPSQEYWDVRNKGIEFQSCLRTAATFMAGFPGTQRASDIYTKENLVGLTKYLYDELQKHKTG